MHRSFTSRWYPMSKDRESPLRDARQSHYGGKSDLAHRAAGAHRLQRQRRPINDTRSDLHAPSLRRHRTLHELVRVAAARDADDLLLLQLTHLLHDPHLHLFDLRKPHRRQGVHIFQ